jgi:DNA-binding SARP family transcriptional activator
MGGLRLRLLGPLEIALDGQSVSGLPFDKLRALLVYLAMEAPRASPRESLAALLWPEYAPESARANLRNALTYLRRALSSHVAEAAPILLIRRDAVQFDLSSEQWVDARVFEELVATDAAAGPLGEARLEEAAALYGGPFLDGFALKDAPAFDDWALLLRERLERGYLGALRRLAAADEARGDHARAVERLRRCVELEPLEEAGQRELMRLLALAGQRSVALAQYERCRAALREELGVEPEAETTRLYERIRDDEFSPAEKASRPPSLPTPLLPLIGREEELGQALASLRDPGCRLLSLVGPGGCGKTRLALEAASALQCQFARGAHFVPLAAVETAEGMVPAIAQGVGFSFYSQPNSTPKQQLLDYMRGKEMLLVLDNCEHLLAGVGLISEILEAAPRSKALATTRTRLALLGEQCLMLGGIAENPAARLFTESARRVRPGYAPSAADLAQIGQICRWVEGMPLAILLASSWMELLSPGEIAAQMAGADGQRLDLLAADYRDLPERQRSMRAVLDHSWRLLSEREQSVLASLSVFRGSFTAEAAQAVGGAGLRDLLRLVDRSLVQRLSEGRYLLHDLLRQYVAERLAAGQETAARDRNAAYYARTLEAWRADMYSPRQMAFVRAMTQESANILAAWEWALRRARLDWVDQMQDSLTRWHVFQFRYPDADVLLSQGIAAVEQSPPSAQRAKTLAGLLSAEAMAKNQLGHSPVARAHLERCFRLLDEAEQAGEDVRLERMKSLRRMGYVAPSPAEQRFFQERALEAARALGNRAEEAQALMAMGQALWHEGQRQRGRQLQESAAAMFRELGHYSNLINVLDSLTDIAFHDGRWDDMAEVVNELQTVVQTTEDAQTRAYALGQLAAVQSALGRSTEALAALRQGIAICEEQGNRYQLLNLLGQVSHALMVSGRYAESRERALRLLPLAQQYDHCGAQYNALFHLLWAAILEGSLAEVEDWWNKYVEYCDRIKARGAYVAVMSGWAACRRGRLAEARQYLREAMPHPFVSSSPVRLGMDVISCLALTWAKEGQVERAVELYALCQKVLEGGPPVAYAEDMFFRPIAKAAASLPPEVREAAEACGRALDLQSTVKEMLAELENPTVS